MTYAKMGTRILVVVLGAFLSTSCIPARMVVTPGVNGTVVDKETNAPISKAEVRVENIPESATTTDEKGYFELRARKEWRPFVIMGVLVDYMPPRARLIVEAAGYQPSKTDYVYESRDGNKFVWISIALERTPTQAEKNATNEAPSPPPSEGTSK